MKKIINILAILISTVAILAIVGIMTVGSDEKVEKVEHVKNHQEWLVEQFSQWDGSLIQGNKLIKAQLNDPDSFEVVETTYYKLVPKFRNDKSVIGFLGVKNLANATDKDFFVITTYRAKNGFGGKVVNDAVLICYFNGLDKKAIVKLVSIE